MEVIRLDKPNFNQLKSVKTPESWVENALKIPSEQKKPLPLFFRPAILGTAASVALAAVLGVLLFMTLGRNSIPVLPATQSTVASQDNTTPTFTTPQGEIYVTTPQGATQPVTTPQGQPATVSPSRGQPTTEPAETGGVLRPFSPVVSPTQPGTTQPGATASPTSPPAPTTKPSIPVVGPPAPTIQPKQQAPTSINNEPSVPDEPIIPEEPATEPVTEAPEEPATAEPWYPWIPPGDPGYNPGANDPVPEGPGSGGHDQSPIGGDFRSCQIYFINNDYFPEGEALTCYPICNDMQLGVMEMQYLGNGLYYLDTSDYGVEFPVYKNIWLFISSDTVSRDFAVWFNGTDIYLY